MSCDHVVEMPALGVEHPDHQFTYDAVVSVLHVCKDHDHQRKRHVCRSCGFWWRALDHNPFAPGPEEH